MTVYYNENNAYAIDWLVNLIRAGEIPEGVVDDRPIQEVEPDDVAGFDQAHFFAGVGGWPYALWLAEWDDPIWTCSCPCQPFSNAGRRTGTADPRHLWPYFGRLAGVCRPPAIVGEQVTGKLARGWIDGVFADLEAHDYSCATADLPAACVDAPHPRQRHFWIACPWELVHAAAPDRGVADRPSKRRRGRRVDGARGGAAARQRRPAQPEGLRAVVGGRVGDPAGPGPQEREGERRDDREEHSAAERAGDAGGRPRGVGEPDRQLEEAVHQVRGGPECAPAGDGGPNAPARLAHAGRGSGDTGGRRAPDGGTVAGHQQLRAAGGVADADRGGREPRSQGAAGARHGYSPVADGGARGGLANADEPDVGDRRVQPRGGVVQPAADTPAGGGVGDPAGELGVRGGGEPGAGRGWEGAPRGPSLPRGADERASRATPWADSLWLICRDGKARRTQPGVSPLAHGVSAELGSLRPGEASPFRTLYDAEGRPVGQKPWRIGMLKGYGNALVPQVAAVFLRSFREAICPKNEPASPRS